MIKKLLNFINQQTLLGEILRFLLVGGLATVIDFLAMGVTMYICQPELYPHFYEAFLGGQSVGFASVLGTGVGFLFGLLANYLLSIIFVFNEKGKSKTIGGAIKFAVFSAIGLGLHLLGMYVFNTLLLINEWIVKIFMTIIVLVYNYLTRKLFIFKKSKKAQLDSDNLDENLAMEQELEITITDEKNSAPSDVEEQL